MLRLRYFTDKTQRFLAVPVKNIDLVDLAWYPRGEDTAREPDPIGFANLEVRFMDGKRMTAKWEVTQNQFMREIVSGMEKHNLIERPADWLRIQAEQLYHKPGLVFLDRGDFWET
jgi:hypothetical protein